MTKRAEKSIRSVLEAQTKESLIDFVLSDLFFRFKSANEVEAEILYRRWNRETEAAHKDMTAARKEMDKYMGGKDRVKYLEASVKYEKANIRYEKADKLYDRAMKLKGHTTIEETTAI